MRGSRKFCQRGPILTTFFFSLSWWVEGGSKLHYKRAFISPPAKRHLNGVSLMCRWWPNIECWLGSFVIFQGIRTGIAKKPYISWFFRGGGPDLLPPPPIFYPRMVYLQRKKHYIFGKSSSWFCNIYNGHHHLTLSNFLVQKEFCMLKYTILY